MLSSACRLLVLAAAPVLPRAIEVQGRQHSAVPFLPTAEHGDESILFALHREDQERGVLSVAKGTEPANYLPLNSAPGDRKGVGLVFDRLVLLLCLLAPCAIFVAIHRAEKRWAEEKAADAGAEGNGQVSRTMSNYGTWNMDSKASAGLGRVFNGDVAEDPAASKEGTHLRNFLSGAVIALGCLPEAISFSFIAGVSPLNGIWAGVFMGLCSSLVGGRPGLISCASAATAVVLVDVAQDPKLGLGAMGLTVLVCGGIQFCCAATRLSRFVSLVPRPVMLGFVNGLAIVIVRAQINQFRVSGVNTEFVPSDTLVGMMLTTVVSMGTAIAFPRIPRLGQTLPAPLAAIVCAILFSVAIGHWFPERRLVDVAGQQTFLGGLQSLPPLNFPPAGVDFSSGYMWNKVVLTGAKMAVVGLVESLLTLTLVDQITQTRGSPTRECFGQALGNLLSGLFGCQGGCALIGQTLINVGSGGRARSSGFTMALGLLLSVVAFAPAVGRFPVAALVGIMLLMALNTFAWGSLRLFHEMRIKWTDGAVIVLVTAITVWRDLATAVVAGMLFSALVFAWTAAADVKLEEVVVEASNTRIFMLKGPLFFGSAMSFLTHIEIEKIPERNVVLDFSQAKILDHSGLDAVVQAMDYLREGQKCVECHGLPPDAELHIEALAEQPPGKH